MCSQWHYLDQVAQHELNSEGPLDLEQKIQLHMEIQVLTMSLKLLGVNSIADNKVANLQVS